MTPPWLEHLLLYSAGLAVLVLVFQLARAWLRRDARTAYRLSVLTLLASLVLPALQWVLRGKAGHLRSTAEQTLSRISDRIFAMCSTGPADVQEISFGALSQDRHPLRERHLRFNHSDESLPSAGDERSLVEMPPIATSSGAELSIGADKAASIAEQSPPSPQRGSPGGSLQSSLAVTPALRWQESIESSASDRLVLINDQTRMTISSRAAPKKANVVGHQPSGTDPVSIGSAAKGLNLIYWFGVIALVCGQVVRGVRTRGILQRSESIRHPAVLSLWWRLAAGQAFLQRARLRISDEIQSPACTGVLRPVLILPRRSLAEPLLRHLHWALRHERVHLLRCDAWVAGLQSILTTVFWFHPAAWWLSRSIQRLREQACDAEVVTATGKRKSYALALLSFASDSGSSASRSLRMHRLLGSGTLLHWSFSRSQLQRRIEMLANPHGTRPRPWRALLAGGLLCLLSSGPISVAAVFGASPGAQESPPAAALPATTDPLFLCALLPPVLPAKGPGQEQDEDAAQRARELETMQRQLAEIADRIAKLVEQMNAAGMDQGTSLKKAFSAIASLNSARDQKSLQAAKAFGDVLSGLSARSGAQDELARQMKAFSTIASLSAARGQKSLQAAKAFGDALSGFSARSGAQDKLARLLSKDPLAGGLHARLLGLPSDPAPAPATGQESSEDLLKRADMLEREAERRSAEADAERARREMQQRIEQTRRQHERSQTQLGRQREQQEASLKRDLERLEQNLQREVGRKQSDLQKCKGEMERDLQQIQHRLVQAEEQTAQMRERSEYSKGDDPESTERAEDIKQRLLEARAQCEDCRTELEVRKEEWEVLARELSVEEEACTESHQQEMESVRETVHNDLAQIEACMAETEQSFQDEMSNLELELQDLESNQNLQAEQSEREVEIERLRAEAERLRALEAERDCVEGREEPCTDPNAAGSGDLSQAVERLSLEVRELRALLLQRDQELEGMRARERMLIEELIRMLKESRPKISSASNQALSTLDELGYVLNETADK